MFEERCFGRGQRKFEFLRLRRGKNPRRWKSRRAGGRALRYLLAERLKQEEATQVRTLRPAQSLP
jgi:hypothetical protein